MLQCGLWSLRKHPEWRQLIVKFGFTSECEGQASHAAANNVKWLVRKKMARLMCA